MASPLPPDPYDALGLAKDCSSAQVKTVHRKLVLKTHPDKLPATATDEERQDASDKFHKIQTAYEILIDDSRRERYDAQVRLAELRKEAMTRQQSEPRPRGAETRPAPFRTSSEAPGRGSYTARAQEPRGMPRTEERRPSYANAPSYFDAQPRATARKDPEHERTSRRTAHDTKDKPRASARSAKDNERERRREKTRLSDKEQRRERERKYTPAYVQDEEDAEASDSDDHERRFKQMRQDDDVRKAREQYQAQAYRQRQEADDGHYDERTRKMFSQTADIRDYIASSRGSRPRSGPEPERRPSPVRMSSSKDKVEYRRAAEGRPPAVVRRSTAKLEKETSKKETSRKASSKTPERRSSAEEVDSKRQPPPFMSAKSSPADIRIPTDKPRAASLQPDVDPIPPPIPGIRRAETMPMPRNMPRHSENAIPKASSNLRPTEVNEGLATPAMTPEYPSASQFKYGSRYADDAEYPTPDGYRTEVRHPAAKERPTYSRKLTRSPSPVTESREPMRETREPRDSRDTRDLRASSHRTNSYRQPDRPQPSPQNTRTTSYVYNGRGVDPYDRPSSSREPSPREPSYRHERPLFGSVDPRDRISSGSPRQSYGPPASAADEGINYRRATRTEDLNVQTGYSTKRTERPTLSRNPSGSTPYYQSVRA